MNEENILKHIFLLIENNTNFHPIPINGHKTLSDFFDYQLDIDFFLSEIDIDFWVDLDQVYCDKLLTTPIHEISEYLEKHATHKP